MLGDVDALARPTASRPFVDLIVITVDPTATARVREIMTRLADAAQRGRPCVVDARRRGRAGAPPIAHLADSPLAPLDAAVDLERRAFAKRLQDLAHRRPAARAARAAARRRSPSPSSSTAPGPVFFRQRRHGFNNEEIVVWKFRTMRHETADARAERQVTADDDRVTRVGRILRKTSLDELPQLLNVVRGEMSLVGPRPHAIGMKTGEVESAQLVAEYAHRHRIKPGMTGWAAINGSPRPAAPRRGRAPPRRPRRRLHRAPVVLVQELVMMRQVSGDRSSPRPQRSRRTGPQRRRSGRARRRPSRRPRRGRWSGRRAAC